MNLNIQLPPDVENFVMQRAVAEGTDIATIVAQFVVAQANFELQPPRTKTDLQAFNRWLDEWPALHPVVNIPVDDSRESIYEGRGE